MLHDCGEVLELRHDPTRYFYRQLSNGLLNQNGSYVGGLTAIYEPATYEALSNPGYQRITATEGGFWIDEYQTEVWRCPICKESVDTGTSQNESQAGMPEEGVYSLGTGWSLGFSHITTDGRNQTLHLADGRELPMEENDFNGLYWYMNGDLHLSYLGDMYQLTYQDGKVEEFDADGRLVEIRDRFSNRITFAYPEDALMKIVDSCGREVIFTESETETGKTLTVSVNGESFAYKLSRNTAREIGEPEYNLSAVSNMLGQETTYHYTDIEAPFSLSNELEAEGYGENYVAALTEIDYPTGASVHYEYFTRVLQDFTSHGSQIGVAIRRRYEQINGATQNEMLYNYGEYEQQPGEVDPTVQIGCKRDTVGGSTIPESENILYSSAYDPVRGLFTLYQMSGSSGLLTNEYSFLDGKKIEEKYVLNLKYMGGSVPQKVRECVTRYDGRKSVSYTNYYAYDRNGNLLKSYERSQPGYVGMDHYGHQQLEGSLPDKSYTYDSRYGLVTRIVEPLPGGTLVTQNTLSSDGKSIVSTTVRENTSVFTYDRDGMERIRSLLLEHGSTSYLYNAQGQMTRKTEQIWQEDMRSGAEVLYTYDQAGRILSVKDLASGTTLTSYGYDGVGRLLWCENADGASKGRAEYSYDHRDREMCYRIVDGEGEELFLRKKNYTDAVDYNGTGAYKISTTEYGGVSPNVTVNETYNLLGDLLQESRSNGTLTYKYDI